MTYAGDSYRKRIARVYMLQAIAAARANHAINPTPERPLVLLLGEGRDAALLSMSGFAMNSVVAFDRDADAVARFEDSETGEILARMGLTVFHGDVREALELNPRVAWLDFCSPLNATTFEIIADYSRVCDFLCVVLSMGRDARPWRVSPDPFPSYRASVQAQRDRQIASRPTLGSCQTPAPGAGAAPLAGRDLHRSSGPSPSPSSPPPASPGTSAPPGSRVSRLASRRRLPSSRRSAARSA